MLASRHSEDHYNAKKDFASSPRQTRTCRRRVHSGHGFRGPLRGRRAALPALDPKDPTATALGFVPDATKVDAAANPTYKPTQKCSNCAQYQGKPGDATAGCNIFAGKSVPAGGWCKVWAAKPA